MKSKPVHKKGKKRPLVEPSSPSKPDQKSENVVESKRNRKKIKTDNNVQNGDSVANTKALQKVAKQKKKQKKVKEESDNNIVKLSKVKVKTNIAKKTKPTVAESKEKTLNEAKEKKLEQLKNKQLNREMNKVISKRALRYKAPNIVPDLKILKNKVSEIRSREVLSKTAKKRIAVLLRKIRVLEKEKVNQSETMEKDDKKDKQQANVSAEKKQKSTIKDKRKTKKEDGKNKKAKVNKEEDNDEDQSDIEEDEEKEEEMDIMQENVDADSVEDEEDEEHEEDDEETTVVEVKKKRKKAADKSSDVPKKKETKKKQHILFVGNLPHDITNNELEQHFLSKVDTVSSVRIPTKSGKKKLRSFAYVELSNNADCEKALSLNHTFLKKKKINVQYAAPKNPSKVGIVAKNKKLEVFCKTGKFTDVKEKKKLSKKGKQKFTGLKI